MAVIREPAKTVAHENEDRARPPGPNVLAWAEWLRGEGYAAFILDSFGGRNLRRLCGDPSPLRGQRRSPDVYAAVAYLMTLPVIDQSRIGAMGWSHGGWTVLWAGNTEQRYPDVKLRALVAFYPVCGDVVAYGGTAPLLMLLGELDDWTPPEACRMVALGARRAGRDVVDVLYGVPITGSTPRRSCGRPASRTRAAVVARRLLTTRAPTPTRRSASVSSWRSI